MHNIYIDIVHKYVSADQKKYPKMGHFWDYVDSSFFDVEDNSTWLITDVCTCNKFPGVLMYSYINGLNNDPNSIEYSDCKEILAQKWCRWC